MSVQLQEFQIDTTDDDRDRHKARVYMSHILSENPDLQDEVLIEF